MIKAISYWSVQGGDGSCSAQDAIQQAKNANFQALELCVGTSGPLRHLNSASARPAR